MREKNIEIDLSQYAHEVDTGLIQEASEGLKSLYQGRIEGTSVSAQVMMSQGLYNHFRKVFKEAYMINLRMHQTYPRPGSKSRTRSIHTGEPLSEMNKFGYNPALERRLMMKMYPVSKEANLWPNGQKYYNIYYLVRDPYLETLYRCDVQRVETKGKMAVKESQEVRKDEEFVNVETSFKKVREIMLNKKFGNFFSDRCSADNKEQKRLKKVIDKEEKRVQSLFKPGNVQQKGLSETYEEKSFIKMVKGPYYQLESRLGMHDDDFIFCAEQDIIDAANT
mmetsp:Transcript_9737/g.9476  ORF Transcript_9737/g.9476 Transcript_9737/m.9476 type:complete len:279 (-) Transcript_9737:2744-3580(-)